MDELIVLAAAMLVAGCAAGVLAGMFGIGGGIVVVPVLEGVLGYLNVDPAIRMHVAVATSLATIVPTSISSARAHHKHGAVDIALVKRWSPFVLAGAILGAWIASQLHSRILAIIFASLAFLIAMKMLFMPESRNLTEDVPRNIFVPIIPAFIGCASSMMGIGGGTFSVMTLTLFNMPIHRAVGTASLFGLAISLPGTIAFIVTGFGDPRLPPGSFGYVNLLGLVLIAPTTVLCAPLGAKIAHSFSPKRLSMLFGLFLLVAAGRLALAEDDFIADAPINCYDCEAWNEAQQPFHIFGNTYYVGVAGISAILIDGESELLLIDAALPQSAQIILENIAALGFDPAQVRKIAVSHAHFDHVGGINAVQRYTGAQVLSSSEGARALRAGDLMSDDPLFDHGFENRSFPAIQNVVMVADGAVHDIGNSQVRGVYTPGHTPGGMTWSWTTCEADRCLDIVYADSLSAVAADAYRFADGLGKDLEASAAAVANMDCDILLVTHPFAFDMQAKYASGREAFIDANGCKEYGQAALVKIQERLAKENKP